MTLLIALLLLHHMGMLNPYTAILTFVLWFLRGLYYLQK